MKNFLDEFGGSTSCDCCVYNKYDFLCKVSGLINIIKFDPKYV